MYKSQLQELCHKRCWGLPEYQIARVGPDHNPRFSCRVIINGVSFETPQNQCRSLKEAQNMASQLAFHHFIMLKDSNSASGAPSASALTDVNPEQLALHPNQESRFGRKDDTGPKEILHTFKNRLQHYAQKHNLSMPAYCSEFEGPPHARRFRAKVTIADRTYESSEYFPTLKEAEHSAARVAFETLSNDDIQEDEGLYKTLLQEFAQKKGFQFPKYDTIRSGPSHNPTFASTVEIGSDFFQGLEAKTKKQAEMGAAKVAFNALSKQCILKEASTMSTSSALIVTDGKHGIHAKVEQTSAKERNVDRDEKIKEQLSSNSETNARLQDRSLPTSSAMVKNHPRSDPEHHEPAETVKKPTKKIIVLPSDSERVIPKGASVMPYSDDQYMAIKLKDESLQ